MLDQLPTELLDQIICYLDNPSFGSILQSSKLFKSIPSKNDVNKRKYKNKIIDDLIRKSDLDGIKYLYENNVSIEKTVNFYIFDEKYELLPNKYGTINSSFEVACYYASENIPLIDFIYTNTISESKNVAEFAIRSGSIKLLQYLLQKAIISIYELNSDYAIEKDDLKMFMYIHSKFGRISRSTAQIAYNKDAINILEYCRKKGVKPYIL